MNRTLAAMTKADLSPFTFFLESVVQSCAKIAKAESGCLLSGAVPAWGPVWTARAGLRPQLCLRQERIGPEPQQKKGSWFLSLQRST